MTGEGKGPRGAAALPGETSGVVYGIRLQGRMPHGCRRYLRSPRPDTPPAPDHLEVTFRSVRRLPSTETIWETRIEGAEAPERLAVSTLSGGFGLTVEGPDRGFLACTPERVDAAWCTAPKGFARHLVAYALPLWLETRGVPVLHGSAVSAGDRAVGFLAPTGTGKSVLCAELVGLGCGYLSDDGLALRRGSGGTWRCSPGPPRMRLWPSGLAGRLGIAPESLPRVRGVADKRWLDPGLVATGRSPAGDGAAARSGEQRPQPDTPAPHEGLPLAALYLLRRLPGGDDPVALAPCSPREGLVHLVEHGVAAAPAAALGLAEGRLEVLADLAEAVPVRRLEYPSGAEAAGEILAAVERDLASTPRP